MSRYVVFLFIGLLASVFTLLGCGSLRNEVDSELLDRQASKLVVTSFISPQDTVLAVLISRSETILTNDTTTSYIGQNIPGATVTLSEGDRIVALSTKTDYYNSSGSYYGVDARQFPILAGHTYRLTVQMPTGERAESSCTIPNPVSITNVTFDSTNVYQVRNQQLVQRQRYFVRARWHDPAGQANYYQMTGTFRFISTTPRANQPVEYRLLRFDTNTGSLQTDSGTDGLDLVSERGYLNNNSGTFSSLYKSATVTVNLLSTDQAYYQYQYAIGRQSQSSGNPFAEPVLIPSNIQGALGCFAGYNRSTVTLRLK